jgi:protein SCO1/2
MKRALGIPLLLLFLVSAGICDAEGTRLIAGVFTPPRQAPEFSLRGSDGADLNLGTYRGKVVILGFGYTSCPNICPTTLAVLAEARRKLGPQAEELQVVYVTVDPETDTPEQMRKYLASFDPTFIGGTGTEEQLAVVRKEYGVIANRSFDGEDYAYAHSSFTYLIDREGKLRALMTWGHSAADYAHDVQLLLKQ